MSERGPASPPARVVKSRRVRHGLVIVNTGEGIGPGLRRRAWTCEPSRGRGGGRRVLHGRRTATGVEVVQPCRRYRDQLADRSRPTTMPMRLQRPQKQRLTSKERPPELFLVAVPKLLASVVFPAPVVPNHNDAVSVPKTPFSIGALGVGHDETFAVQYA